MIEAVVWGSWRRSSYSSGGDNCVDAAATSDGTRVRVRDSKNPDLPPCMFSATGWAALLTHVAATRPEIVPAARTADKEVARPALNLADAVWRPAGLEAEFAFVDHTDGVTYVVLRQDTVVLVFTMAEWDAFLAGVHDGEFALDHLVLLAQLEAEAARAGAEAVRTGSVVDSLIADRRAEAVRELRERH